VHTQRLEENEMQTLEASNPTTAAGSRLDRRWLALVALAVAQFMVFLDETVVNVALPSIKLSLGFSQATLAWVVSAYIVVFGGLVLLGGRLADLFGRRRVFLIGTVVFGLASLLDGLAQSQGMLLGARALPGGWRRAGDAGRAGAGDGAVSGAGGAGQGAGDLGSAVGARVCDRDPAGRRDHSGRVVAVGVPD
jgi:MFS family permease